MSDVLDFPYFVLYSTKSAKEMFESLKKLKPLILHQSYKLDGYIPDHSIKIQYSPMPPKFCGKFCVVDSGNVDYFEIDGICDWYTEKPRMKAKKHYVDLSPYEIWKNMNISLENKSKLEIKAYRDDLWKTSNEVTLFRPSWAKGVLLLLLHQLKTKRDGPVKLCDLSTGWGDRLLVATIMDMDYIGFDPNIALKPGHDELIAAHGDLTRHQIIYSPVEQSEIPYGQDIVFSSPPFFDLEEYTRNPGQSILSYPTRELWFNGFLLTALNKAWTSLKPGGIMAIHLADYKKQNVPIKLTHEMLSHVGEFPNNRYLGIIGLRGERGKTWPVWVWQKYNVV